MIPMYSFIHFVPLISLYSTQHTAYVSYVYQFQVPPLFSQKIGKLEKYLKLTVNFNLKRPAPSLCPDPGSAPEFDTDVTIKWVLG
jgi:hypothetical protein